MYCLLKVVSLFCIAAIFQLSIFCDANYGQPAAEEKIVRTIAVRKLPYLDLRFRHLMLDDYVVQQRTASISKIYHQAKKIGRPLLKCEGPHEREAMSLNVPSVLYDRKSKKFRMWWHNVWFKNDDKGRRRLVIPPCYAESQDGLYWTKPKLHQLDYRDDGGANNCIAGIEDPLFSVCFDHQGKIRGFWCPRNGTCIFEDGIKVTHSRGANLGSLAGFAEIRAIHGSAVSDQWRVIFDPVTKQYRATAKTWATLAGSKIPAKFRRAVTVLTSEDAVQWKQTRRIIQTDAAYDAYAERLPNRKDETIPAWSELHDMNMQRYEGLLIGLNCILFTYDEDGKGGREIAGTNTKHFLTWSRDGLGWSRPVRRVPLIPATWGTEDWGRHTMGSPFMVVQEKEIWMYCDIGHGHTNRTYKTPRGKTITMSKLRRDGFASLRANGVGWLETAPMVASGALHLNVDAARGSARVAVYAVEEENAIVGPRTLTPIEGFTFEACQPTSGDQHAAEVNWKSAKWSQLAGRKVVLRIQLTDADLYSFWTRTGSGGDVVVNLVENDAEK